MNRSKRSLAGWTTPVLGVIAAVACTVTAVDVGAQGKTRLVYGAQPTGTSQYLQAVQHMNAIGRQTGYDIVVQESAGSEENMLRIAKQKTAQFGAIDAVAVKGKLGETNDIRTFANYAPIVWQIIVAEDANINSLKDLHGKKFNSGPTGGGSTKITLAILKELGIKQDNFEATLNDALDAYADRRIVGLSYRGTGSNATGGVIEANAARPVKFVPFSDAEIEVAKKLYPSLTKAYIEANVYPKQPNPIPTIGSWQAGQIGVHKDVPADVVYNLLKAYFDTLPEVAKQHKSLLRATPENSVSEALLPLHAGAVRYYRERGITIPDRLIPPEAK